MGATTFAQSPQPPHLQGARTWAGLTSQPLFDGGSPLGREARNTTTLAGPPPQLPPDFLNSSGTSATAATVGAAAVDNGQGESEQQQLQQQEHFFQQLQQQHEMMTMMRDYESWSQQQQQQGPALQHRRASALVGERWREGRLGRWGEDDTAADRAAYLHMQTWKARHKLLSDRSGTNDADSGTVGSDDGGDGGGGNGESKGGMGDAAAGSGSAPEAGGGATPNQQQQKRPIVPMESDEDDSLVLHFQRPPINVSLNQGHVDRIVKIPWHLVFLLVAAIYLCCGCMSALLLLGVNGGLSSASGLTDNLTAWETVAWSGYSNLLGAGNGDFIPTTSLAYFLCTAVQFLGIILNVVFAALVLFKCLRPKLDFALSEHALLTERDGASVLVFRVGDYYHPSYQLKNAEIVVEASDAHPVQPTSI